jgi:ribosomal protein L39E
MLAGKANANIPASKRMHTQTKGMQYPQLPHARKP